MIMDLPYGLLPQLLSSTCVKLLSLFDLGCVVLFLLLIGIKTYIFVPFLLVSFPNTYVTQNKQKKCVRNIK